MAKLRKLFFKKKKLLQQGPNTPYIYMYVRMYCTNMQFNRLYGGTLVAFQVNSISKSEKAVLYTTRALLLYRRAEEDSFDIHFMPADFSKILQIFIYYKTLLDKLDYMMIHIIEPQKEKKSPLKPIP